MSEKHYAFGRNKASGCECPAVAAGFEPASNDGSILIAEYYDGKVSELGYGRGRGVIPEEKARKAWKEALYRLEECSLGNEEELEVARKITEKLGWS